MKYRERKVNVWRSSGQGRPGGGAAEDALAARMVEGADLDGHRNSKEMGVGRRSLTES